MPMRVFRHIGKKPSKNATFSMMTMPTPFGGRDAPSCALSPREANGRDLNQGCGFSAVNTSHGKRSRRGSKVSRRAIGTTPAQQAWLQSPRAARQRKDATERSRQARKIGPTCGAKTRSGEPCRRPPAPDRTRCRFHGGAVPRGDEWGVVQWPADPIRRKKKEAEIARRRAQQAARVASMTPDELARHIRWHETHPPGGRAARARARQNREAAALLEPRPGTARLVDPEADRVAAELERLRAAKAALQAQIAAAEAAAEPNLGVDILE